MIIKQPGETKQIGVAFGVLSSRGTLAVILKL